jgi:RNA polymerase sigma factor (sigma-70 family)
VLGLRIDAGALAGRKAGRKRRIPKGAASAHAVLANETVILEGPCNGGAEAPPLQTRGEKFEVKALSKYSAQRTLDAYVSDARLVADCLNGNEEAWHALIDRYAGLIYSIPLKYGLSADDAAEIFQSACLCLFTELPKIRDPKALPAWLIQVTAHRCSRWQHEQAQFQAADDEEMESHLEKRSRVLSAEQVREIEVEQTLRDALAVLSPQCRQLIHMLFYESPARPYEEVAATLGLAIGSIGFTRRRCLERLRKYLERADFGAP